MQFKDVIFLLHMCVFPKMLLQTHIIFGATWSDVFVCFHFTETNVGPRPNQIQHVNVYEHKARSMKASFAVVGMEELNVWNKINNKRLWHAFNKE